MKLQSDSATIRNVISAFAATKKNWEENPALSEEEKKSLCFFFEKRWLMFAKTRLGMLCCFLRLFLELNENDLAFLETVKTFESEICRGWVQSL